MKKAEHRSSLFLLELIFNLFLFVICAAVCVGLLLHARSLSVESRDLTNAVYLAQSVAERWRGGVPPEESGPSADGLQVKASVVDGEDTFNVSIYKGERLIYSLEGVSRNE